MSLLIQALTKVSAGIVLMDLLLFAPAGTLDYPEGWRFMLILFVPMVLEKSPDLLRKRLTMKEKLDEQKQVILMNCVMFVSGFITAGLSCSDHAVRKYLNELSLPFAQYAKPRTFVRGSLFNPASAATGS